MARAAGSRPFAAFASRPCGSRKTWQWVSEQKSNPSPAVASLPAERPGAGQNRHGLARRGSFEHRSFPPEDTGDVRFQIDSRDDLQTCAGQGNARIPHQKGLRRFIHLGECGGNTKRCGGINREKREAPVRRFEAAVDKAIGGAGDFLCGRQNQTGPIRFRAANAHTLLCGFQGQSFDGPVGKQLDPELRTRRTCRKRCRCQGQECQHQFFHGVWGFCAKYCLRIRAARGAASAPPVPRFKKITRATSGASAGA